MGRQKTNRHAQAHSRRVAPRRPNLCFYVLPFLLAMVFVAPAMKPVGAVPGSPAGGVSSRVHRALRYLMPTSQTSTDEDELQDLQLAPFDTSLSADRIMRSRPFIIEEGAEKAFPVEAPEAQPLTEGEARDHLQRFLELRGLAESRIDDTLASFDSRKVKRIVPAPTLRASLLMLTDWDPYEATIRAVLDGENPSGEPYRTVDFDNIGFAGAIATLYEDPRDGRHSMVVDSAYAGEPPVQLIPVVVHESLHGGDGNSAEEEIVANILDTICYAEVLLVDPRAAYQGTDLAFFNNLELLALLNSTGRGGAGQVGIATSTLGDVFVGGYFGEFDYESIRYVVEADGFYDSLLNIGSPGQQTTAALIARFPGGKALGKEPYYGEEMLAVIDRGVGKVITPKRAVKLVQVLGLHMTTDIREASGGGRLASKVSLDARPFAPRDPALFDPSGAKRTGKTLSEEAGRESLAAFLDASELPTDAKDALMARYGNARTAELIPDPSLRAATLMLGALKPWDLALGAIFDANNPDGVPLQVLFADLRNSAPAARQSDTEGDGTPAAILINSLLFGESPELLASAIVEGTLLHDDTWTTQEAIAAALMGTLAYAAIAEVDPTVVKAKTWGVLNRNRDLVALLNSAAWPGDDTAPANADSIGFLSAPNEAEDILPGLYADATSFANYVETLPHAARFDRHADLEAPPIFAKFLAFAGIEPTDQFRGQILLSEQTMHDVDAELGGFLSPDAALGLARTLKLGVATGS
ncbi:MAG: hypothetical protein QOF73_1720 [Thermomicrobiales bacterium]|nr:hypothetical protein [Thermomicrobiales bacterium]